MTEKANDGKIMKVKILISFKNGVLDPQAKAITHALHTHGFEKLKSLKLSKEVIVDIEETDTHKALLVAKDMCESLLANVVIEDYHIEIL